VQSAERKAHNGIGDTADLLSSEGFSHTRGNGIGHTADLLSSEGFSHTRGNGIGHTADLLSSEGFSHTRGNGIGHTADLLSSEGFSYTRDRNSRLESRSQSKDLQCKDLQGSVPEHERWRRTRLCG
jgi:hypothetical protein